MWCGCYSQLHISSVQTYTLPPPQLSSQPTSPTQTHNKMPPPAPLTTPLTRLLGVPHPIMLAGMDQVAGPELVAAVTNAGGFGTLGGARYTPTMLREMIADMKSLLKDKYAPFGVDLLIPAVGGSARKTNVSHGNQVEKRREFWSIMYNLEVRLEEEVQRDM
jgi:hypothetical protein